MKKVDETKALTRKQQLFVEYYRRGFNSKQAALKAGYSLSMAENASTEILQHPRVQEEINRRDSEYFERVGLDDPDWVIRKITSIANANPADYMEIQDDGTFKVDLRNINRDMMYAVRKVSYDLEGRPDIEFESRPKALETLLKIYITREEQRAGTNGAGVLTLQALDSIVQKVTNNNVQINILASPESSVHPKSVFSAAESSDCLPVSVGDPVAQINS